METKILITGLALLLAVGIVYWVRSKKQSGTENVAAPAPSGGSTLTTSSGLQYVVLQEGTGDGVAAGKKVTVHYTGWLTNGTKFDSSLDRGRAFDFTLGIGQVIKGWDEGVQGMKVGEKRKLLIPSALGYGPRGAGGVIPPNADLVFEVTLLGYQ
jgi:FKBP-type peptidyl-prolyl cis-trans isomerase FkpA